MMRAGDEDGIGDRPTFIPLPYYSLSNTIVALLECLLLQYRFASFHYFLSRRIPTVFARSTVCLLRHSKTHPGICPQSTPWKIWHFPKRRDDHFPLHGFLPVFFAQYLPSRKYLFRVRWSSSCDIDDEEERKQSDHQKGLCERQAMKTMLKTREDATEQLWGCKFKFRLTIRAL